MSAQVRAALTATRGDRSWYTRESMARRFRGLARELSPVALALLLALCACGGDDDGGGDDEGSGDDPFGNVGGSSSARAGSRASSGSGGARGGSGSGGSASDADAGVRDGGRGERDAGGSGGGGDGESGDGAGGDGVAGNASDAGGTPGGPMGTQPLGALCANDGNCNQDMGEAVCCVNSCELVQDCPESPGYLPCNSRSDCAQYGGGKICCDVGAQRFCTKQSACSGDAIP